MSIFNFKVKVTHWRSTDSKCAVLTGDAVGRLSIRHVIKILSEFSITRIRVSVPYIMLLFI